MNIRGSYEASLSISVEKRLPDASLCTSNPTKRKDSIVKESEAENPSDFSQKLTRAQFRGRQQHSTQKADYTQNLKLG
jgi:hypothetical protein